MTVVHVINDVVCLKKFKSAAFLLCAFFCTYVLISSEDEYVLLYIYFQVVRDAVEEELATIESLRNERKSFYHVDPSKLTA